MTVLQGQDSAGCLDYSSWWNMVNSCNSCERAIKLVMVLKWEQNMEDEWTSDRLDKVWCGYHARMSLVVAKISSFNRPWSCRWPLTSRSNDVYWLKFGWNPSHRLKSKVFDKFWNTVQWFAHTIITFAPSGTIWSISFARSKMCHFWLIG